MTYGHRRLPVGKDHDVQVDEPVALPLGQTGNACPSLHMLTDTYRTEQVCPAFDMDPWPERHVRDQHVVGGPSSHLSALVRRSCPAVARR